MTKRLQRDDYTVAWICPLEVEQVAAKEMLDEEHDNLPQLPGDSNVYKLGSINGHNIVIAGLYETGNSPAATVVAQMRMTFPNLKFGLLIGIGSGVPVETDNGMIRLGHVVVSKPAGRHSGVMQYDHGKAISFGQFEQTGFLAPPPAILINAVRQLGVQRARAEEKPDPVLENVSRINPTQPGLQRFQFQYPGEESDYLFPAHCVHRREGMSCEAGGCDLTKRIPRVDNGDRTFVTVHRGNIASGERVIKDAELRDDLARQFGLLCFEMEAAGVAADFPCLTVRGISDYCDSHKNDRWHGYAAAVAAGYARQLFFHMPVEEVRSVQRLDSQPAFKLTFQLSGARSVDCFVAREVELKRMHELLKGTLDRRTVVLHGLGGMGKTQTAIEYAKRHRNDYSAVIWFNARDAASLKESYQQAATRILRGHPTVAYLQSATANQDLDEMVAAVKRWLDEGGNDHWLVVYDNYDAVGFSESGGQDQSIGSDEEETDPDIDRTGSNPYGICQFLPEAYHGAVIITTRLSTVDLGHLIRLPKLDNVNDSLAILASTSHREQLSQEPDAVTLARKLDGLPLALATAGAYLSQVSTSCTEYLKAWDESWLRLQETTPQPGFYERAALYTTWQLSFEHIREQNPDAAMLLQFWAYFDKGDLWYELLREERSANPVWLQRITEDKLAFAATMRILCEHGLAEAIPPTKESRVNLRGYSVHDCIHAWITNKLNEGVHPVMAFIALRCVATHIRTDKEPGHWEMQRRLLHHVDRCSRRMPEDVEPDEEKAWLFNRLGLCYKAQGRPKEAEAVYRRGLQMAEKALGPENNCTSSILNNLAGLYLPQGRLEEAKTMLERVLEGREKVVGRGHISTLDEVRILAGIYADIGEFEKSENMYDQAIEGFKTARGVDHILTLETISDLASLYQIQGRLEEAEAMYNRALQGKETASHIGPNHTSTLATVNNLGGLYSRQGRIKEAEAMYRRAAEGFQKALPGSDNTHTLPILGNLATNLQQQGRLKEAEATYREVIEGYERTLEPDFMRTYVPAVKVISNLGILLQRLGEPDKALLYFKRARDGCKPQEDRYLRLSHTIDRLQSSKARRERFRRWKEQLSAPVLLWGLLALLGLLFSIVFR